MLGMQRTETPPALAHAEVIEQATRQLRLAANGNPTGMLVEGTRGSGKTHLATEVAEEAARQSFRVAELDARWSAIPFSAIDQLVRQLDSGTTDESVGIGLLHTFRLACRRAGAGHAGVALIIDNAELLMAEDVAALHNALLSPPIEGFFVLFTASSGAGQRLSSLDFARAAGGLRLRMEQFSLESFSLEEAIEAAEQRIPGQSTQRFVQAVHELAAGNARYLFALLDSVAQLPPNDRENLITGSDTLDQLQLPAAVADELLAPFELAGPTGPLIAQALGVLRQPAESDEIAVLLELPPDEVEDTLAALEAGGLTRTTVLADDRLLFEFQVPLTGLAARALLSPLIRRKLNRSAARLKEQARSTEPNQAEALAFIYLDGVVSLSRERAEWLVAVAEQLVTRSRYQVARRVLEDVLRRADPDLTGQVRTRALIAFAETLSRSGAAADAGDALDAALGLDGSAGDAPETLVRKAREAMALGRSRFAAELLEAVLTRDDLSHRTRLRAMTDLSKLLVVDGFDEERARQLANTAYHRAISVADWPIAVDDDIAIHIGYLHSGRPRLALAHGRRALVNAHHENVGESILARAIAGIGHALMDTATLERGLHWIRRAHVAAELAEDLATASWTSQLAAGRSLENGDWDQASRWAATAIGLDSSLHRERSLLHSRALDAQLRAAQGQTDKHWSDPANFPDHANIRNSHMTWVPVFIAHFEHTRLDGNFAGAAELIDRTAAELRGYVLGNRTLVVDVLPRIAESARESGNLIRLRAASEELGVLSSALGSELFVAVPAYLLTQSQIAEAEGDWSQAKDTALEAAQRFRALGYHWRAAISYQLAGEMAAQLDEAEAAEHLMQAYRFYDAVGARHRLAVTRHALEALGAPPRRARRTTSILTARQTEIAGYAATGETDAEIAERLSISRRTVTTHMHNILGRLDLDSRQQLGPWLDKQVGVQSNRRGARDSTVRRSAS
jgi:DNA-binding CsgD family transcriptional regulator/tetratricopeptide (TPR) repeat protein